MSKWEESLGYLGRQCIFEDSVHADLHLLAQALKAAQLFVQQPCSNPSEYPERLGKAPTQKCGYLQEFCKL
jgi:hypothetical protein